MSNPCPIQTFMNVFFFIFLALYPHPIREEEPPAPNKPGLQLLSRLYQWMTQDTEPSPQDTHKALYQDTPKTGPDDFFPLPPGATTVQQYLQPAVIILAACVVVVLLLGYCMCAAAAGRTEESRKRNSPTLRCVLQLRISRPQWVFFNGVKGQTGVIVQSDPSISINGSLLLGQR